MKNPVNDASPIASAIDPFDKLRAGSAASLPAAPFDHAAFLDGLDGNRTAAAEMIRLCLEEDAPRLLADLREGLVTRDFAAIEHAAHGLKGLLGEFHAPAACAAARDLESASRGHESESIPGVAHAFFEEFEQLSAAMRQFLAQPSL